MDKTIEIQVKENYAKIAQQLLQQEGAPCCDTTCCNDSSTKQLEDRKESLGCDLRLIEVADPQKGEIVIDLGSGPGHDTREVARRIDTGIVHGIDFGEDMIKLARSRQGDLPNINYILAPIDQVPLPDNTADLIISNCVLNLVPDKSKVFDEIYRLLKPGGRMVVSDMITAEGSQTTVRDLCACIGGATSIDDYLKMMEDAGLEETDAKPEYESSYQGELGKIDYQSVLFIGYKPE